MPSSYCIMCGKETEGIEVQNDYVLSALRWFKRNVTKDEKKNRIVVCKACYLDYKKKLYLALGIVFLITFVVLSPKAETVLISLVVLAVLYLFSLFSYIPKI